VRPDPMGLEDEGVDEAGGTRKGDTRQREMR